MIAAKCDTENMGIAVYFYFLRSFYSVYVPK